MTVERLAVMDTSHLQDWVNGNTNNSGRCTDTTTLATTLIRNNQPVPSLKEWDVLFQYASGSYHKLRIKLSENIAQIAG